MLIEMQQKIAVQKADYLSMGIPIKPSQTNPTSFCILNRPSRVPSQAVNTLMFRVLVTIVMCDVLLKLQQWF